MISPVWASLVSEVGTSSDWSSGSFQNTSVSGGEVFLRDLARDYSGISYDHRWTFNETKEDVEGGITVNELGSGVVSYPENSMAGSSAYFGDGTNGLDADTGFSSGQSFSYSVWVHPDDASEEILLSGDETGNRRQFYIQDRDSDDELEVCARFWGGGGSNEGENVCSPRHLETGEWSHIALTFESGVSGDDAFVYINGTQENGKDYGGYSGDSDTTIGVDDQYYSDNAEVKTDEYLINKGTAWSQSQIDAISVETNGGNWTSTTTAIQSGRKPSTINVTASLNGETIWAIVESNSSNARWEKKLSDGSVNYSLGSEFSGSDEGVKVSFNLTGGKISSYRLYASSNSAPVFESVSNSEVWSNGNPVEVTANASDSDGTVSNVEASVYEDGQLLKDGVSLSQEPNGNWTVSDLFSPGEGDTEYKVELNATDNSGASTVSNVSSKTTGNVSLSWSHSGSPDGFKTYSNATGSMSVIDGGVSSSPFEHISTALGSGDYVCYEVTAYNSFGESSPVSDCATVS